MRLKDRFLDDFHVKRIIDHTWEWIWNLCYKNNTVLQQNPLKTYDNHHEKKKNHVWRQFIPKKLIRQRVQVKTLLVLLKVSIQNVMPSITTNLWLTNRKFTKLLRDYIVSNIVLIQLIRFYCLLFSDGKLISFGVFLFWYLFFSVLKHVPDILGTSLLSINYIKPVYMETFKLCSCMVTKSSSISSYFFKG